MSTIALTPRDADRLADLVAEAEPKTRFELAAGRYPIPLLVGRSDVALVGKEPADTVLELKERTITVEEGALRLEGLTVRGGHGIWGGGITVVNGSHLELERCLITGNRANRSGGGVYLSPGSAKVSRCLFSQNTALGGAALFAQDGSEVSIDRSLFLDNTAEVGGALMLAASAHMLVKSCTFLHNQATYTAVDEHGGTAVALLGTAFSGPQLQLTNCLLGDARPLANPPDKAGMLQLTSCLVPPGSLKELRHIKGGGNLEAEAIWTTLSGLPLLDLNSPGRGMADITEIDADAQDYLKRPLVVQGDADPGALGLLRKEEAR